MTGHKGLNHDRTRARADRFIKSGLQFIKRANAGRDSGAFVSLDRLDHTRIPDRLCRCGKIGTLIDHMMRRHGCPDSVEDALAQDLAARNAFAAVINRGALHEKP